MAVPLHKLLSLGRRGWLDLLAAQAALLRAQWRLRTQPVGSLVARAADAERSVRGDPVRAREIATAVVRAAHHGLFRPFCLVQALAIQDLLVRDGIHGSSIRVGVRRWKGQFGAHAWVRWNGIILGDSAEHVATFSEVDDIRVLGRS